VEAVPRILAVAMYVTITVWVAFAANRPSLPAPTGPYGVGRVAYEFTDSTRPEPLSSVLGAHRRLMVYVWYPTDSKQLTGQRSAPYLPGFDQASSKIASGDIADMFRPAIYDGPRSLPSTAVVDNAPLTRGVQKFPLLLFAHGWGNPTFLYTAELQDIVSHGYIIAAIDHPYDTNYTQFLNGEVTGFAQASFDKAAKRPYGIRTYTKERVQVMAEDNRYALTQLLSRSGTRKLQAPFYARINEGKIGAFGHSIGGLTLRGPARSILGSRHVWIRTAPIIVVLPS
jgi:predicted dienelactone hydrolase